MLVVLYAVIHEKKKGVPCMGCFSCAFAFDRTFVFGLCTKILKTLKPRNLKTFLNLGFFQP